VPAQLVRVEIDLAQIAGRVALGLVVEVRRARVAALAAGADGAGADAGAELDGSDEAVAAQAVIALGPVLPARAERGERAPGAGGEADGMLGAASLNG
jgi:hypothetical protein